MNYLADLTASPGYWLLLAVAIWVLYKLFEHSCEASPLLEDEEAEEDAPKGFTPNPLHIKSVLAEIRSLSTPLQDYKLPRAGAVGYVPGATDGGKK